MRRTIRPLVQVVCLLHVGCSAAQRTPGRGKDTISDEIAMSVVSCEPEPVSCKLIDKAVLAIDNQGALTTVVPDRARRLARPNGSTLEVLSDSEVERLERAPGRHPVLDFIVTFVDRSAIDVTVGGRMLTTSNDAVRTPGCPNSEYRILKRNGRWICEPAEEEEKRLEGKARQ